MMIRGIGLTCPEGQTPTNRYDGTVACCGGPPDSDPCSYLNTPQYIETQRQAQANAIAGDAGSNSILLAKLARYPQNVQNDALNCYTNPGSTFIDPMGKQVNCPAPSNNENGIFVSIYTPDQLAAMLAPSVTPTNETPINVVGTSIPATAIHSVAPRPPGSTTTAPGSTLQIAPSGGSIATVPTGTPGTPAATNTGIDFSFLTNSAVAGIPNWALAAGVIAALMILPGMMGGRR